LRGHHSGELLACSRVYREFRRLIREAENGALQSAGKLAGAIVGALRAAE
jgi:hypothetical protein